MSDLRSLPDRTLKLLLWPLGAWGVGLLVLYVLDETALALTLCFPLAAWLGGVTLRWGRRTTRRLRSGDLSREEAAAGVVSVAHILAGAALTPAIVFLARDPLAPSAWSTVAGIGVASAAIYFGSNLLVRLRSRFVYGVTLLIAWLALPAAATGGLSVATWLGWFDQLLPR